MKPNSDLTSRVDRFVRNLHNSGIYPSVCDIAFHRNGATISCGYKAYGLKQTTVIVEFPKFGNWVCIQYRFDSVTYKDTNCDWFPDWIMEQLLFYREVNDDGVN